MSDEILSQALPTQTPPEKRPTRPPRSNTAPSWISCSRCKTRWTGLAAAHCSACHRTFTSIRPFDIHRRDSQCLDPATITTDKGQPRLVPANRPWPGWSEPGTWDGPS